MIEKQQGSPPLSVWGEGERTQRHERLALLYMKMESNQNLSGNEVYYTHY